MKSSIIYYIDLLRLIPEFLQYGIWTHLISYSRRRTFQWKINIFVDMYI